MNDKKTCGECMYCDEDEFYTEDDYFWFSYCTMGLGPEDGISNDTPACNCFRPLPEGMEGKNDNDV